MYGSSTQGEALEAITARGFQLVRCKPNLLCFDGELRCRDLVIPVSFEVTDWNFLTYPIIRLREPKQFPDILPHVLGGGVICYFGAGRVILDRYDPAGSFLCCLDQAEAVLTKMIFDPASRKADFQNEFSVYWVSGQSTLLGPVLIGDIEHGSSNADIYMFSKKNGLPLSIVSQNHIEASAICKALGYLNQPKATGKCWLLDTDKYPPSPADLPKDIRAILTWIKQWDIRIFKNILRTLETDPSYLDQESVSFSINSPAGWIGFAFPLDLYRKACCKKAKNSRSGANTYKQYLLGSGGSTPIERPAFFEAGSKFIHDRNLRHQNLRDKKLVLIGCGAIGGYLAHALAKLGAGSGSKGKLILVDNGHLMPENIGRHLLGTESLFSEKSEAVKIFLEGQFPLSNVKSHCVDISKDMSLLESCDLVIDATGEEAVSEFLNGHHMLNRGVSAPHLYVWVRGNGECVQSLWVDNHQYGCYRCLRQPPGPHYRQERFSLGLPDPVAGFVGCHAFTPYAVSAPLSATSLATDAVIAWLNGDPIFRFRTRYIEETTARRLKNQNISPVSGCQGCMAK